MLLDRADRSLKVARARGSRSAVLRAVTVAPGEGIAGRVAADGRPLLVEEIERDERLRRPRRPRYATGSFLVVPLRVRRRVIGVINLADKDTDAPFSPEDLDAVLAVTDHASLALQRAALHGRVRELREQALTDPLTGLGNRRFLEARLREEAGRTRRRGSPFALSMIDLDDFKSYNDREGHPAGDALLAAISRVIRAAARDTDQVVRYGGDEFAVVSPDTSAAEAVTLVGRLLEAVAAHGFGLPGLPQVGGVTLSAGVACFPDDAANPEDLVSAADAALYRAKASGRARVVRAGS
jgi:diguanylate cyclase (GGDEF)-like protein